MNVRDTRSLMDLHRELRVLSPGECEILTGERAPAHPVPLFAA